MKKQIPILFSTAMVQAILEGRKSVTRRVIKPQPGSFLTAANWKDHVSHCPDDWTEDQHIKTFMADKSPYGKPGDILWVREEHYRYGHWVEKGKTKTGRPKWRFVAAKNTSLELIGEDPFTVYYSDEPPNIYRKSRDKSHPEKNHWYKRLARFMPKRYARIWLEVTDIRVERLQEIGEADAKAEGAEGVLCQYIGPNEYGQGYTSWVEGFKEIWRMINGDESWHGNAWVWAVSFKILSRIGKPAEMEPII